jgi:large subunit ribosomal protein L9
MDPVRSVGFFSLRMEVLLLQDIPGIGKKNDLLIVGDGYALNFLLPKRAALVATPLVRKRYAEFIRRRAEERERERSQAEGVAAAVAGQTVAFTRKATKTGKLYAAISEEAIAEALQDQHGTEVSPDDILINRHIKTVGTHDISVRMGAKKLPLTVEVTEEKKS